MNVYGLPFPSKSLINHALNEYAEKLNLRSFRGVFMRDPLPSPINETECAIVNLDDSNGCGTHWVCYWRGGKESFYSDSFGLDPPHELFDYLDRPLHYSTNEIQEKTQ